MKITIIRHYFLLGLACFGGQWMFIALQWDDPHRSLVELLWFALLGILAFVSLSRCAQFDVDGSEGVSIRWAEGHSRS